MVTIVETVSYYGFLVTIMGAAAYLLQTWLKRDWLPKIGLLLNAAGALLMLVAVIGRTRQVGRLPLNSVYEYLLVLSFAVLVAAFAIALKWKPYLVVGVMLAVAAVLIGVSFGKTDLGGPLLPALQSNWRVSHVLTAIISYTAFAVAFGVGVVYLIIIPGKTPEDVPAEKKDRAVFLEKLMFNSVVVGFIFLTLLIITGAIWAEEAWGSWWTWDPKETWALITWIIYAIYLHLRLRPAWRGKKGCYLSILGFVAVLFTLLGVTYIFGGLHSYG